MDCTRGKTKGMLEHVCFLREQILAVEPVRIAEIDSYAMQACVSGRMPTPSGLGHKGRIGIGPDVPKSDKIVPVVVVP